MKLINFLTNLEKIIIILIILCFIPIMLFAYLPEQITIPPQLQTQYDHIHKMQLASGFLTTHNQQLCSSDNLYKLALETDKCMQRCVDNVNCNIINEGQSCNYRNKLTIGKITFCSNLEVRNAYDQKDKIFELDSNRPPLANVFIEEKDGGLVWLGYEYYCLKDRQICRQLTETFDHNIQQSFEQNYKSFNTTRFYLMYFGFIPLTIHIILVFILDTFWTFNLRLTNSLMITHQSIIGAAIILIGILYNLKNDELVLKVQQIGGECLMDDVDECSALRAPFQGFDQNDGISDGFMIVMGFILALQILFFIAIVLINILIRKYYQLRSLDPRLDGEYQLQTL